MIRIPTWLFVLLVPAVFFGGCAGSLRPVWRFLERAAIRPVRDDESRYFPVLAFSEGKYIATVPSELPPNAKLVVSLGSEDEAAINRDLCDSIGSTGSYRFFQVLSRHDDFVEVSLEVPTRRDRMTKGWYAIHNGEVRPQKILSYGPGFAFAVIPYSMGAGLAAVTIYLVLVRRRVGPKTPSKQMRTIGNRPADATGRARGNIDPTP